MKTYGAYRFKNKDPSIDLTRTMLEDDFGRRVDYRMLKEVSDGGGPSVGCMAGWFFGETMRPNNTTIEACGRARGYERVWVKQKKGK